MDAAAEPLLFFEGEDQDALKQAFIDLCAKHYRNGFSHYQIAQYIFRDLKEPELRALQAADYWGKDLAIADAVRQKVAFGDAENARDRRLNILMNIAEDSRASDKDRIAAVLAASTIEGEITKAIDKKVSYPGMPGGKALGSFLFKIDPDAGKPPIEVDEDVSE